jgi:hypothetical protein
VPNSEERRFLGPYTCDDRAHNLGAVTFRAPTLRSTHHSSICATATGLGQEIVRSKTPGFAAKAAILSTTVGPIQCRAGADAGRRLEVNPM